LTKPSTNSGTPASSGRTPAQGNRLDPWYDVYADRAHNLRASEIRALFSVVSRPEVVSLAVRRIDEGGYLLGDTVTPGDHVLLRMADPYMGNNLLGLKVLETSGDKGDWITCACRELIDPDI